MLPSSFRTTLPPSLLAKLGQCKLNDFGAWMWHPWGPLHQPCWLYRKHKHDYGTFAIHVGWYRQDWAILLEQIQVTDVVATQHRIKGNKSPYSKLEMARLLAYSNSNWDWA